MVSSNTFALGNTNWFFTDLRWNNIGLLGGRSLLDALHQNHTLLQLEMAGNNIPSDTLKAIGMTNSAYWIQAFNA